MKSLRNFLRRRRASWRVPGTPAMNVSPEDQMRSETSSAERPGKAESSQMSEDPKTLVDVQRNILLIGTAGRGKSSTGNSILGQDLFQVSDGTESQTNKKEKRSVYRDGRNITVFDALTLPDERMSKADAKNVAAALLGDCFDNCPEGFDLLLFVLNYNSRITEEEALAVKKFQKLLGRRTFSEHCVVVFTHGESFMLQHKKKGIISFEEWLQNSTDALLKMLVKSSNWEPILFYNESPELMTESVKSFFENLDKISSKALIKRRKCTCMKT